MAKSNYETVKDWRKRNPEKVAAQAARRRGRHPEKFSEAKRRFREKHGDELRAKEAEQARIRRRSDPEAQRARNAKHRAKRARERELIAGRPRPEICELCEGNHHLGIVFDHCHRTGKFRGWICDRCNKVLGIVQDDPVLLRRMADYLDEHHGEADIQRTESASSQGFCGSGSELSN